MMKVDESIQLENVMLLKEICTLKTKMKELYQQKGPCCPDYISHSLKLNSLVNQYLEEKIVNLSVMNAN
jgi:hypothetical protein